MTEQPREIDMAAILETLRAEVRAARATQGQGETGTALSVIEAELHHCAEQLEITRVVSAHWPLEGKNLYERGWILVHKVVRRGLKWYIPPIVEQQNAFNDAAARTVRLLIEAHAELRDQLADLRRQLDQTPPHESAAGPQPSVASRQAPDSEQLPPTAAVSQPDGTQTYAQLQQLVERAGRAEPPAPLPDLGLRPLPALLADKQMVSAHWPLTGDNPLTQARALVQRTIRQYLRWMLNPIVEQQNAYNATLAATLPHLLAADAELRARVAALRATQQGQHRSAHPARMHE